jgi:hypothetical protein
MLNKIKLAFLKSYKLFFKESLDLNPRYDIIFKKHLKLIEKLDTTAENFYDSINRYIQQQRLKPDIKLYNENIYKKFNKVDLRIKSFNEVIENKELMEYYESIKNTMESAWNSKNIFKDYPFCFQLFHSMFLIQDKQFMELYNNNYDFMGFREVIKDYIKCS